ncbi:MAG: SDR family NAD(P)-dependent oxidoreductase [Rubrivivax sp.]
MQALAGKTALVTGASSGIGEALARQLASRGVHLVLVARSQDRLQALAQELAARHGVQARALAADLAQPGCGAALQARVQALGESVDILVNNAGFGTYGPFEEIAPAQEQREIALNVAAVVDLTHAFLPAMLARGEGVVLNVASTAAFQPTPYLAVYGATKAFVLSFSEALWAEYRGRGIHVAALCPGAVDTAFIAGLGDPAVRHTSVFASTLSPESVARRAVQALLGTSPTHIIGAKNWLMAQSARITPRRIVAAVGAALMRPARLKPRAR